jgi:hypothetical protein
VIYVKKKRKKKNNPSAGTDFAMANARARDTHGSDLQFSGKCILLHCERSLLRLVASISSGELWTLLGRWGERPGRKSAKRLFTYRSSYLRITVRPRKSGTKVAV